MKLEFHQLDRHHEHLRVWNAQRQRQLLASLATSGQQTPIIVVALSDQPDRYQRSAALAPDRSLHWSERESALEAGARVHGTKRSRN